MLLKHTNCIYNNYIVNMILKYTNCIYIYPFTQYVSGILLKILYIL